MTILPVLHLKLDEGSGGFCEDASGSGNHGSIAGSASWVTGKVGKALSLDGSTNYIVTPTMVQLTNITMCAWIKPATQINAYASAVEICNSVTIRATLFWNHPTSGKWQFRIRSASTEAASPAQTIPINEWHHIAGTYDGATIRFYYDGVEVGSGTAFADGIGTYADPVEIGRAFKNLTYAYIGLIDDVYVFDRALSQAEIRSLIPVRKSPVLHMRFDEGSGSTASDSSGMGNHGTLVNTPTWVTGKYGKAINSSGAASQHIRVPEAESLELRNAFSIAVWVYHASFPQQAAILWKGESYNPQFGLGTIASETGFRYWWTKSSSRGSSALIALSAATWNHIVYTYDGTTLKCFVNGVDSGVNNAVASPLDSFLADDLLIGRRLVADYCNINGSIDELLIFNRALSASEILDLFTQTPPKWIIQFYDGTRYVEIRACKFSGTNQELNGAESAVFLIPNTEGNRVFVLNDYPVRVLYNNREVFSGVLKAVGYSLTSLACTVYNDVYEQMQRRNYSGSFASTAADSILGDIFGIAGGSFGNNTLGASIDDTPTGYIETVQVRMINVSGAMLSKLSMYCYAESGTANVKCAIYEDNSGAPGALVANGVTDEVAVTTTPGWVDFPFSTPPSVSANAYYWLAWMSEAWIWNYEYGSWEAMKHLYNVTAYVDGFPATLTSLYEDGGKQTNIYATIIGSYDGECPSTVISAVKWENVLQYKAATDVAKLLQLDFWGKDGVFNIGVRNSCKLALGFDEGAGDGAFDASGNGKDATLYPAFSEFTFGRSTIGTTTRSMGADTKVASKFIASASGTLSGLTVRCRRTSSSGYIKAAIYADSAGLPGALIAEAGAVWASTSAAWRFFPFTEGSEPSVANGTSYWLAISSGGAYTYTKFDTGTNLQYNNDTYSNGFSNPFGTSSSYTDELCAYATGYSSPPEWVDGRYGKGISFDGSSQYATFPKAIDTTTDFTASVWCKPNSVSGYNPIFRRGTGWYLRLENDEIRAYVWCATTHMAYQSNNANLTAGLWIHVAMVYSAQTKTAKLYLNGVELSYGTSTPGLGAESNLGSTVYLGTDDSFSQYFNGAIDEAIIYQRAFTVEEIGWLYNQKPRGCKRNVDRSKRRTKGYCKGFDAYGNRVTGESGSGDDTAVLSEVNPADQDALDASAERLLGKLDGNLGAPISVPISTGAYFVVGDTVPIHVKELGMDGFYRIKKIAKLEATVALTFEKTQSELLEVLGKLKNSGIEQVTARSGNRVFRQADEPTDGMVIGDFWVDTDASPIVVHIYDGADWDLTFMVS